MLLVTLESLFREVAFPPLYRQCAWKAQRLVFSPCRFCEMIPSSLLSWVRGTERKWGIKQKKGSREGWNKKGWRRDGFDRRMKERRTTEGEAESQERWERVKRRHSAWKNSIHRIRKYVLRKAFRMLHLVVSDSLKMLKGLETQTVWKKTSYWVRINVFITDVQKERTRKRWMREASFRKIRI